MDFHIVKSYKGDSSISFSQQDFELQRECKLNNNNLILRIRGNRLDGKEFNITKCAMERTSRPGEWSPYFIRISKIELNEVKEEQLSPLLGF